MWVWERCLPGPGEASPVGRGCPPHPRPGVQRGSEGDAVRDRNWFSSFPRRILLTVSKTHESVHFFASFAAILSQDSIICHRGSGPFVGILLLLLIPFKPFPTQFPEQLLFCLKPSSGFPSHWEENIYSRPQSHVQSNPQLSLWLDLLYVAHCTPASRAILLSFKKAKFIPRSIDLL